MRHDSFMSVRLIPKGQPLSEGPTYQNPSSIERLILVIPPQLGLLEGFANGVISLANYVGGHLPELTIETLDLGLTSETALRATIEAALAEVQGAVMVGISTTTASYQSALIVAGAFRSVRPDCVVVFGGHHASTQGPVVLSAHKGLVDIIVHDEGEVALTSLIEKFPDLGQVPGISYVEPSGKIRRNRPAQLLSEEALDSIHPDLEHGQLSSAPGKFDHITYVSARGCPLRCSFCSEAGQAIRAKSVPAILADIRHLVVDLGYRSIAIEDNFFAHSRKRTIEICSALAELRTEVEFGWDCQTRVESLDRPGLIRAMQHAGCTAVYIGVEALNEDHLLYLGKSRSPKRYLQRLSQRVVPDLLASRIDCFINLQLGLPDEDQRHRVRSLEHLAILGRLALAAGKLITVFPQLHVVYPGTQHFREAVRQDRFGPETESVFERFTAWENQQQPIFRWLGEHFAHGVGGIPEGILEVAALRRGTFQVDPQRVMEVSTYLRRIEDLPGISVFRYGSFLAKPQEQAEPKCSGSNELDFAAG